MKKTILSIAFIVVIAMVCFTTHASSSPNMTECNYYFFELHFDHYKGAEKTRKASFSSVFQCKLKLNGNSCRMPEGARNMEYNVSISGPYESYNEAAQMRRDKVTDAKDSGEPVVGGLELKDGVVCYCPQ